jgi:hypothetical protein
MTGHPSEQQNVAFEVWKYYASVGGADKDRMVQISTWLLAFSAAILGLLVSGEVSTVSATRLLTVLGILVSLVAGLIAVVYGGYAAWNWAIADEIAELNQWEFLRPTHEPVGKKDMGVPLKLAKPRPKRLAPIFWIFIAVATASTAVHVLILSGVWRIQRERANGHPLLACCTQASAAAPGTIAGCAISPTHADSARRPENGEGRRERGFRKP